MRTPVSTGPGLAGFAVFWLLLLGALPMLRLAVEAGSAGAWAELAQDAAVWRAARRSLVVAAGATALSVTLGVALAALLLLREVPGRRVLIFLAVLPLLVPPQIMALGFLQAAGPGSPLLLALGLAPPIGSAHPLHGPLGMVLVLGVQGAPLVFLGVAALVRRIPGETLIAARGLGASPGGALRRVAWPLLLPGLAAGAGLAWIAALGNFGVAALIGIPGRYPVLTVLIWRRLGQGGPEALGEVALLSVLLAGLALPGLAIQRFAARAAPLPTGRPFAPMPLRLRGAGTAVAMVYLLVVLGLPMLSLLLAALVPAIGVRLTAATFTLANFAAALAPGAQTGAAFGRSLVLSGVAALVLAAAAGAIALAQSHRSVRLAGVMADLPYALPGACIGVAAILIVLSLPGGGALYGTAGLILIAYLSRFQALALRPAAAAAARLDPALDLAARGMGAGPLRRIAAIHLPLLAPALGAGAILVMLLAVNEVTVSALLHGPGSQTLGVLVFNLQDSGSTALAAAVSCLALLLVAVLMALASLAARRLPAGTLPWRP
ncbi:iron ABC transporter permease [Roseomonas sp. HF4]|uniref:ABC transporter permease n=1 Tax=Roseomonas sp. HF4 TaxID=2562313 RepID=UPI0010C1021A|nr:ABC transporter permease subunit [Roseomonas sp. HF4]